MQLEDPSNIYTYIGITSEAIWSFIGLHFHFMQSLVAAIDSCSQLLDHIGCDHRVDNNDKSMVFIIFAMVVTEIRSFSMLPALLTFACECSQ